MCSVMSDSLQHYRLACQAPLSMEFSRQEYWSGLPFPSPEDLPNPGMEPASLVSPALAGRFFTTSANREAQDLFFSFCACETSYPLNSFLIPSSSPWHPPFFSFVSEFNSVTYISGICLFYLA